MSHEPNHDAIREALRSLPRTRADDDFTERVLERIEGRGGLRRPRVPVAVRWATAATLAAAAVLAGSISWSGAAGGRAAERERRTRIEALEAERLRLAAELEEIRRLASSLREPAPVLYLGGDDEVDLVIDLDRLAQERPAGTGATPTAYRGRRAH